MQSENQFSVQPVDFSISSVQRALYTEKIQEENKQKGHEYKKSDKR